MRFVDLEQGSNAWHEYRRKGIGASDIAKILKISPFGTPFTLFEEKEGKEIVDNPSMRRGREREIIGVEYANRLFNTTFFPKVIEHYLHPWLFCSVDGIDMDGTVLEVKWCNKEVHSLANNGVVIDYYYSQCQAQMACCDVSEMIFLSCYQISKDDPIDYAVVKVKRDDLFIQKMIEKASEFYHEYMVKGIAPPLTDKDYTFIEDDLFDQLCTEYTSLTSQEKMLSERKKQILEDIKIRAGDKNARSSLFKATKFKSKGRIDYSSIKELEGVNLEPYRKESSEQWRVSG